MKKASHLRLVAPNEQRETKQERAIKMQSSINLWGSVPKLQRGRKEIWPDVEFWGRFFSNIEAKQLAKAESDQRSGKETIRQRLLLEMTRERMNQSKTPFSTRAEVSPKVWEEYKRLRKKFELIDGGKFFAQKSQAQLEVVS